MSNKFNKFYAQSLKLKAASADPYFKKKSMLEEKINKIEEEYEMKKQQALQKLQEELNVVQKGIDDINNIVKSETGYTIEDLCYKEGKKWMLKYPDTVVPVKDTITTEEPTESGLTSVPNDGTMPAEAVEEESVNEETGEIEEVEEHNDFQY